MGGVCNKENYKCPIHPNETITRLCMHNRCIEPLCSKCLEVHYQQHKEIGSSPDIQDIDQVKDLLLKSIKCQSSVHAQAEQLNQAVREIYPAEYIKQLTREYFIRKRSYINSQSGLKIENLIENVQASQEIAKNPSIRQIYFNFLKDNTRANMGVLTEQYSHLY